MAIIHAPNKQFTGASASVNFVNGVGETDNAHLIDWFRDHGYAVEDGKPAKAKPKDSKGKAGDADAGETETAAGDQ